MKTTVLIIGLSALLLTGCIHGHHGYRDNYGRYDRDGYSERDSDYRRYDRNNRYDGRYYDNRRDGNWRNKESR